MIWFEVACQLGQAAQLDEFARYILRKASTNGNAAPRFARAGRDVNALNGFFAPIPAQSDPEHAYLFSFFLCRLKLRYAFLQNGNSTFEVIYCAACRVKFLTDFSCWN
jgi:hypothetical protein